MLAKALFMHGHSAMHDTNFVSKPCEFAMCRALHLFSLVLKQRQIPSAFLEIEKSNFSILANCVL